MRGRDLVVEVGVDRIVLRAELDARDVAHAHHRAVRARRGRRCPRTARATVSRPSVCTDSWKAPGDVAGGWLIAPAATCRLAARKRGDDVARRQAARRDLGRIEPDAHRIVARAEDAARRRRRRCARARPSRRASRSWRCIADRACRPARSCARPSSGRARPCAPTMPRRRTSSGKPRLGDGDAVLHQHLRLVDVGAGLEHDVDRQPPVAGRLRDDVEHVVDAVDLLLDRRRDRFGDDLRRGARIGRA